MLAVAFREPGSVRSVSAAADDGNSSSARHRRRRDAADLVLLDDNFATIVAAVEQGRSTFANIRRFLTYHLADNGAELAPFIVWALSAGRFPLAIGVLQVLALDIGTGWMTNSPEGRHYWPHPAQRLPR